MTCTSECRGLHLIYINTLTPGNHSCWESDPFLSVHTAKILVQASYLGLCGFSNTHITPNPPTSSPYKMQLLRSSSSLTVLISQLFRVLHWFPFLYRITFKLLVITFLPNSSSIFASSDRILSGANIVVSTVRKMLAQFECLCKLNNTLYLWNAN